MLRTSPSSLYRWEPYPALSSRDLGELSAYPRVMQKLLRIRGVSTRREAENADWISAMTSAAPLIGPEKRLE